MGFVKFGDVYLDLDEICGVTLKYEYGYPESGVAVVAPIKTDKIEEAAVFFKSGAVLKMDGEEAEEFEAYWLFVNEPKGDIS